MSGFSPSTSLPRGGLSRHRRALSWAGLVLALVVVVLVAAAVVPGSGSSGAGRGRLTVAERTHAATVAPSEHTVFGSANSPQRYGELAAQRDAGVNASGQVISAIAPVPARRFAGPIAGGLRDAESWGARLARPVAALTGALRTGDRAGARRDWDLAFSDYLHLGAVYGLLPGALNDRLAEVPPIPTENDFPGLHRLEKGLWTGQRLSALVPIAVAEQHAVAELQRALPGIREDPLQYATRAHEILEDAQRDLMSGADVPWSGAGVLGTAADLVATRQVIATLVPLLQGRENTLPVVQFWLARLSSALQSVRRPDGGEPTLAQLSPSGLERIDAALAGACAALSAVPGTLETHPTSVIPSIPGASR